MRLTGAPLPPGWVIDVGGKFVMTVEGVLRRLRFAEMVPARTAELTPDALLLAFGRLSANT